MLKPILLFLFMSALFAGGYSQEVFLLEPSQSMSITGKGPGQDAAVNPYSEGESKAIVENIGKSPFTVRVQKRGSIIQSTKMEVSDRIEIKLLEEYELYLDSDQGGKATIEFRESK